MTFCTIKESNEFNMLREIMHKNLNLKKQETLESLLDIKNADGKNKMHKNLNLKKQETLESLLDIKNADEDGKNKMMEMMALEYNLEGKTSKDVEDLLKDYQRRGYIDIEGQRLKIKPKGARILGQGFLKIIMEKLTKKGIGIHTLDELGYGAQRSRISRRYELGDVYDTINIERTFLNTLESNRRINQLKTEDFEVYESLHQTKMNIGILIDESGSMIIGNKVDAALETALALFELMKTNYSEDNLRIFTFSECVKEIPIWDIPNINVPMRHTDIKAGLRTYRRVIAEDDGDKHAFLITDSEPNFQDGRYIGFHKGTLNVLEEASRYQQEGIILNIFMLDKRPHLKEFAIMIAKRNLGRVVFTNPENLGEAIIEDYLTRKREKIH